MNDTKIEELIVDTLKHFPDGLTEPQIQWIMSIRMENEELRDTLEGKE